MMRHKAEAIIQRIRDDYNAIATAFSGTRQHAAELAQFRPFLADGQQVLDWGCGNGRLLYLLKDFDLSYYGVDQSRNLLKEAKKNPLIEFQRAQFFCTANKDKNFEKDFFDIVFMIASFHHLPDEKTRLALLKKTFKEMKSGASIIMTNWNLESDWAKAKLKKDWDDMGDGDYFIPWKDHEGKVLANRYYHHFDKDEISDLLKQAGFKVQTNYFASGSTKVTKKEGKNLVTIAKKP